MKPRLRIVCIAAGCALLAALPAGDARAQLQDLPPLQGFDSAVSNPEADAAIQQGNQALQAENYEAAATAFQRALNITPTNPQASLGLGKAYLELQQYQQAETAFNNAIFDLTSEEARAEAFHGRGKAALAMNRAQEAYQDFQQAVELAPQNAGYLFSLGRITVQAAVFAGNSQQIQTSIDLLTRALEIDQTHADAFDVRSQAFGFIGDFENAIADARQAVRLNPDDETYHHNLGQQLVGAEQYDEGMATFDQALATAERTREEGEPPYIEPLVSKVRMHLQLAGKAEDAEARRNHYRAAIAAADQALQLAPQSAQAHVAKGLAFRMMEEYGEAVKAFTEALRLSPDDAEVLFRRGIVWYYLGESSLAMADFRQSSDINYRDVRPYMWQGFTYANDGDYYDAVLAYSQALEQNNRYAPAYDNRGLAYLQLGQYRKAVADFNEVIRIQPTDARAYYKRGVAHAMQSELDQAAASYRVAVSFDPDFAIAHRQLSEVYQRLGNSEAAARHRQQADQIESRPAEAAALTQATAAQRT